MPTAFAIARNDNAAWCRRVLVGVSRTFALNIPQLPPPLDLEVTVAYLLCRLADTVEDEVPGSVDERCRLLEELAQITKLPEDWRDRARRWQAELLPLLRAEAPAAERELAAGCERVFAQLSLFRLPAQEEIARCVEVMTRGMAQIARRQAGRGKALGLADTEELFEYCYAVAGCVGEMLTRLFAVHSPGARARLAQLSPHAVAFGRALQLTNIAKDVQDDLERGACWVPRTFFAELGIDADDLGRSATAAQRAQIVERLVQLARAELDAALAYSLTLPEAETGMRLFCLWPLLLAARTLREVHRSAADPRGRPKVGRAQVYATMGLSKLLVRRNAALRLLYRASLQGVPAPAARPLQPAL